jgi:hypothetical protein
MRNVWKIMAVVVPLTIALACTDAAKAPAEAAMAAAGDAMNSLRGDAARYAPDAVKSLESSYGTAKDSLANKDYQGALLFAKDIPAKAKEALAKADATKTALAKAWNEAADGMNKTIHAAKSHLDMLSRSKNLPAGMDKTTLAKAKIDLESLQRGWSAAVDQSKAGDLNGAIAKAKDLSAQGLELLKAIGIK